MSSIWRTIMALLALWAAMARAQDGGEFARAAVGFEQAGAASASPVQKAFFDLYLSSPFPAQDKNADPLWGPRLRIWGDVRFDSAPQQINANVKSFAGAALSDLAQLPVNQLARSVELLIGLEYRISSNLSSFNVFDRSGRTRASLHWIAAFGMLTPSNPQDTVSIFEKPNPQSSSWAQFAQQYPGATGAQYDAIAFVTADRNRFLDQYYGGLRFENQYLDTSGKTTLRPPLSLDLMVGQNEAVSGGRLHGPVLRVDAYYPLPFAKGSFLYLYASAVFQPLARPSQQAPLLLQPSAGRSVYDPDVYVAPLPPSNRDFYRLGVGIDFMQLVRTVRASVSPAVSKPAGTT